MLPRGPQGTAERMEKAVRKQDRGELSGDWGIVKGSIGCIQLIQMIHHESNDVRTEKSKYEARECEKRDRCMTGGRDGSVDGNCRAIYRIGENRGTSPIIMRTKNVLESGMQSNCVQGIQGGRRISARTRKSMEQGLCSESIRIVRFGSV